MCCVLFGQVALLCCAYAEIELSNNGVKKCLKSKLLRDRKCLYVFLWAVFKVVLKGGFFSESAMCFSNLQISKKDYSEKLSWT